MQQYIANLEPVLQIKNSVGFWAKKCYLYSQDQPSKKHMHAILQRGSGVQGTTVRVQELGQDGSSRKWTWTR